MLWLPITLTFFWTLAVVHGFAEREPWLYLSIFGLLLFWRKVQIPSTAWISVPLAAALYVLWPSTHTPVTPPQFNSQANPIQTASPNKVPQIMDSGIRLFPNTDPSKQVLISFSCPHCLELMQDMLTYQVNPAETYPAILLYSPTAEDKQLHAAILELLSQIPDLKSQQQLIQYLIQDQDISKVSTRLQQIEPVGKPNTSSPKLQRLLAFWNRLAAERGVAGTPVFFQNGQSQTRFSLDTMLSALPETQTTQTTQQKGKSLSHAETGQFFDLGYHTAAQLHFRQLGWTEAEVGSFTRGFQAFTNFEEHEVDMAAVLELQRTIGQIQHQEQIQSNKKRELQYLDEMQDSGNYRLLPSGILLQTVKEGQGPAYKEDARVVVIRYTMQLPNGTTIVEHTLSQRYAVSELLDGLQQLLPYLHEGDVVKAVIPSKLLFGEAGNPPYIGPYMPITFDLEFQQSLSLSEM